MPFYERRNSMKKIKVFLIIMLSILVLTVCILNIFSHNYLDVKCIGISINTRQNITESELLSLNNCYDYFLKYYSYDLPSDENELLQIYNDLEIVLKNDCFFKGFEDTSFQQYLLNDDKYYRNDGVYKSNYLKLYYYVQLISIKMKVQLLLGDYQGFSDDYKNNFALFVFLNLNFPDVLLQDNNFQERSDLLSKVCDAYDLIIQCSDNKTELAIIYQSTLILNATTCEDVRIKQYSKKFFEYVEYLPDNLMNYEFKNSSLNPYKIEIIRSKIKTE